MASGSKGPDTLPALPVREGEPAWTAEELAEVRAELEREVAELRREIAAAEGGLNDRLRDSGDGAGDDQADTGSKTFERENELSVAANARSMLVQAEHALAQMDARMRAGTYGVCESCGKPIGKLRLQAFHRATLCVSCKAREERR